MRLSPGVPVTTNFMPTPSFRHLDYHQWAPHQDVVSADHYVVDSLPHPRAELAFTDLTRGGRRCPVAPHGALDVSGQLAAGQPGQGAGQTIRDSLAHVARGADTIGFFQWRQSRAGSEEVPLRRWSRMRPGLGPVPGGVPPRRDRPAVGRGARSRVEAQVALLWDYQAVWALGGPAMPSARLDGSLVAETIHRLLRTR